MEHLILRAVVWMVTILHGCLGVQSKPIYGMDSNIDLMRREVHCVSFFLFFETNLMAPHDHFLLTLMILILMYFCQYSVYQIRHSTPLRIMM